MILDVDTGSPVPPYEQIRAQITAAVAGGALLPGTRLPAIRQLAGDLGLAPGTIARAYRELEQAGLVVGRGRHGTRIADGATDRARPAPGAPGHLDEAATAFAHAARRSGATVDHAVDAVRRAFATMAQTPPLPPPGATDAAEVSP